MQTALASLWRDSFVRGPCPPSCSGRQHDSHTDRRLARRSQERAVQTHISANASIGPAATQAAPVVTTTSSSSSPSSTWSMETVDEDWAFESTTVGLSSSKALKINLDLKLVSCPLTGMCWHQRRVSRGHAWQQRCNPTQPTAYSCSLKHALEGTPPSVVCIGAPRHHSRTGTTRRTKHPHP